MNRLDKKAAKRSFSDPKIYFGYGPPLLYTLIVEANGAQGLSCLAD